MVDTVEKKNDMRQMSVVVSPSDVDGRQMIMVMEPDPLPGWTLAITAIWKDNWIHDSKYTCYDDDISKRWQAFFSPTSQANWLPTLVIGHLSN